MDYFLPVKFYFSFLFAFHLCWQSESLRLVTLSIFVTLLPSSLYLGPFFCEKLTLFLSRREFLAILGDPFSKFSGLLTLPISLGSIYIWQPLGSPRQTCRIHAPRICFGMLRRPACTRERDRWCAPSRDFFFSPGMWWNARAYLGK